MALYALANGYPYYNAAAEHLAHYLRYRPARKGILPVTNRLRALERCKLVGRLPPADQWSRAKWFLTEAGIATAQAIEARRAATGTAAVEDESAVGGADAPNTSSGQNQ